MGRLTSNSSKKWNPISKEDNEAQRFPDQPNQKPKQTHFERILQVHITKPHAKDQDPNSQMILSIRSFCALWHRYSTINGDSQKAADDFYENLLTLLRQEEEGTSRTAKRSKSKTAKERTSWATPAPLLDILAKTFGITYERYCSPLNFSPIFAKGSTIGNHKTHSGERVDSQWGFDYDARLQDWRDHFGYANPEWLENDLLDCINRAAEATLDGTKAVRNIAIIPYNKEFPRVKENIDKSRNHKIIAIFEPHTLAFTPPQVMKGTRSNFGTKPYANAVALVTWENSLAPPPNDDGLALLGKWCAATLATPKTMKKSERVIWSETVGTAANAFQNPTDSNETAPHPFWAQLACDLTPENDNHTLLCTTAGVIPNNIKNIFAATHANPAHCSAQLEKLTHDMIVLFHEAWKESNNIVKPITFKAPSIPDPAIGYDSEKEGIDPDPACRSDSDKSSTSESEEDLPQTPGPAQNLHSATPTTKTERKKPPTLHTNQVQKIHTTVNFLKRESFKTHTTQTEFGRPKMRSMHVMLENIQNILVYDVPLQKAQSAPDVATTCRYCKDKPAVREFPNTRGGTTASCAPCRTQLEIRETYGRYTNKSIKCHICGSHQNRSNKIYTPKSPEDPVGWARSAEGHLCAPCKATERRQINYTHPPVNFALPKVRRQLKHNKCLICKEHSPQGGTFLHHRICTKHNASAPTAHQLTTARVWQYLTTHYPIYAGTTHNPLTISNFVTAQMAGGRLITESTLEHLAKLTHDSTPYTFDETNHDTTPPPYYTMWLLTTAIPHIDVPMAPHYPPTPPHTPPKSPIETPPTPTTPSNARTTPTSTLRTATPTNRNKTLSKTQPTRNKPTRRSNAAAERAAADMGFKPTEVRPKPDKRKSGPPQTNLSRRQQPTQQRTVVITESPQKIAQPAAVPSLLDERVTRLCAEMVPHNLSSTNAPQLGDLTAHIDGSDLPEIPGWTLLTSDSSDVSSDTSTRGRRKIQRKIDENNSHMERVSIELDRAQRREARYRNYINRKPPAEQDETKMENRCKQTSAWLKEAEKHRRLSTRLSEEIQKAKQHRFVRPPTPIHPAWDVGLPSAQTIQREMEKTNENEYILEDRGFRITRSTLRRLAWPASSRAHYLDTSIIDTYCALLTDHTRELREGAPNASPIPVTHVVSAMITLKYFPTACGTHDLDSVLHTAAIRNIPLDEVDLLVFPLNPRGTEHWWSVTFDFRAKTIINQNSSANPARNTIKYVRSLKTLVEEAYRMYHEPIWSCSDWKIIGPERSPKQQNAYDCGVFMCMAITCQAHGTPTTITQEDMVHCRQHIAKRILANRYFTKEAHDPNVGSHTPGATGGSARKTQRQSNARGTQPGHKRSNDTGESPPRPGTSKPRQRRGPINTTPYSDHSIKQRQRWHHASTHRPLSPIHMAPTPPDSPTTPHTNTKDHPVSSRPTTPSPHASPSGEGRVGGRASPHRGGGWSPVRGRERETTSTSPTDIHTIKSPTRNLDFGELDPPTNSPTSGAAEYTRRHTHPG